jgi:AcrR family transcriptional regulator
MTRKNTATRARDREATETRLVEALERVISRDGFKGLGVNAVAREAGVDKVLIYRYFGDLEGLIDAFGSRLDLWVGQVSKQPANGNDYAARIRGLLRGYVESLRQNPSLRQILAWELVDSSPILRKLDASRSKAVAAWFAQARGNSAAPSDADAPAVNALLLAGMHYLVLREQSLGSFAGMDLRAPDTWERLERAAGQILSRAYADPAKAARSKRPDDRA